MSATDTSSRAEVKEPQAPATADRMPAGPATADPAPSAVRTVGELLDELGGALDLAFAKRRRRFASDRAYALAALLLAGAAGLAVFALTRPAAPPAPRPIAAVKGLVERGRTDGVAWALAVSPCGQPHGGYAVSLVTREGSSATGCAGASRPADTIYDQAANVALVFGSAPAGATRVEIAGSGGDQSSASIARQGPLRSSTGAAGRAVLFVGELAFAQTATAITAYGSGARLLEACSEQRCVAP